ncbi:VPLPA-CTERM sorting domain-containing protein [Actibacterium sp. XHP0104]|uniref:VPLPA-CTERM sorting domain-containing protein n=1 Tax=Actibacterium sp. XHP0104 TaxID=2984335 RepID=UPI0021E70554|nr:VPLPA-CTERM sorting domain-containing protein [Actibacterium sp. XHP0104]MCV2882976.1 VPLPA-CTERM sorting domain-containing protein [Actibacterium sp. XHP0104]
MKFFKLKAAAIGCITALALASGASAASLSVVDASVDPVQNTKQNPCIIAGTVCPTQPASLPYTKYNNAGNLSAISEWSPEYTVAKIRSIAGNVISIGLDVNQTNANSPQTLVNFAMYINGALIDQMAAPVVVAAGNNGIGWADWLITGFTSLAGYGDNDKVQFFASMRGMNDGPEKFFLVGVPGAVIPLPATGLLLLGGLGGLIAFGRRRKTV